MCACDVTESMCVPCVHVHMSVCIHMFMSVYEFVSTSVWKYNNYRTLRVSVCVGVYMTCVHVHEHTNNA